MPESIECVGRHLWVFEEWSVQRVALGAELLLLSDALVCVVWKHPPSRCVCAKVNARFLIVTSGISALNNKLWSSIPTSCIIGCNRHGCSCFPGVWRAGGHWWEGAKPHLSVFNATLSKRYFSCSSTFRSPWQCVSESDFSSGDRTEGVCAAGCLTKCHKEIDNEEKQEALLPACESKIPQGEF